MFGPWASLRQGDQPVGRQKGGRGGTCEGAVLDERWVPSSASA